MGARQRGVALITVLLLVASISLLAVQLNDKIRFNTQRTLNRIESEQAYWYARGGETLARLELQQALQQGPAALLRLLNDPPPAFATAEGQISYRISALHHCFNLNSLGAGAAGSDRGDGGPSPAQQAARQRLLALGRALALDSAAVAQLSDSLNDWLDPDPQPQGAGGAESDYYLGLAPGYRAADSPMISGAELALVRQPDGDLESLRALLCVREDDTGMGVNPNLLRPAQAPLLSAMLHNKLAPAEARALIELRPQAGYSSLEQFFADPLLQPLALAEQDKAGFSLDSTHFLVRIDVRYLGAGMTINSLMQWNGSQLVHRYRQMGNTL